METVETEERLLIYYLIYDLLYNIKGSEKVTLC